VGRNRGLLLALGGVAVLSVACLGPPAGSGAAVRAPGSAAGSLTSPAVPVSSGSAALAVGDPARGRQLIITAGCGGCHTVEGVPGATGVAGPNLTNVAVRPTLAGDQIPMTPENLVDWLLDPPAMKPGTAMPKLGLSRADAQDLAAFILSQPDAPSTLRQ
jgi:cytochrome c2